MIGYIYMSENMINGMRYIGKHKSNKFDKDYKGSGNLISEAIKIYGKDNFKVKILEECDCIDDLNDRETYFIELFNAVKSDRFYNRSYGKESEGWEGVNRMYSENPDLSKIDKYKWSHHAKGRVWIHKDNIEKYIDLENINLCLENGWKKGRISAIISKGNKNRDPLKCTINKVKCRLEHNNIIKMFNSVHDLCVYCKEHYDLSSGTVKLLLNTEEAFNPQYLRLEKARGLKLKRIKI